MLPAETRFWEKVQVVGGECWGWLGAHTGDGYGVFWTGSRDDSAHRFSYYLANGPIPRGLTIDHLCRNRGCVNPAHMQAVTNRENLLRGNGLAASNAKKTHCPRGHVYEGSNLYLTRGKRYCRACKALRRIKGKG